jgi:hypothetical protein
MAAGSMIRGAQADAAPAFSGALQDGDLYVRCGEHPVLQYRGKTVLPPREAGPLLASSGYVHPFHAPCGVVVTDHFSLDHLHQRGVFAAWTKTRMTLAGDVIEPDFWNIHLGTGRIRSVEVAAVSRNGAFDGFRTRHVWDVRHRDAWEPVLDETWRVTFPVPPPSDFAAPGAAFCFDVRWEQTPRYALELLKYHYGGMAVRGSGQ